MEKLMHKALIGAFFALFCVVQGWTRGLEDNSEPKRSTPQHMAESPPSTYLQSVGVHDAGNLYCPFSHNLISSGYVRDSLDPETGLPLDFCTYPNGSRDVYIFGGAIWVGGIVNGDTLVSVAQDGWINEEEIFPENILTGGMQRVGGFADDEFVSTTYDTFSCFNSDWMDDCDHLPMGLKLKQVTRSWADPEYDDFILIDYTLLNIGNNVINDGWAGILLDADIFDTGGEAAYTGFIDDCSGSLDTLLQTGNSGSGARIGYTFDNDGDPNMIAYFDSASVRGVISISLLGASFEVQHQNFNWWISNGSPLLDFGPRRVGTPEDPFRDFGGYLGTPVGDENKYYVLSHPEIDYDQIETAVHDSSDGWIPTNVNQAANYANGWDSRFLLSFGPFDLNPGDSATFTIALVGAGGLHVNPRDFEEYFDYEAPEIFYDKLDFSEMILNHQKAYAVYQSGYTLPLPGPPTGLKVVDYDDDYVDLAWNSSLRPNLEGYYISYKDTAYDDQWRHLNEILLTDTTYRFLPPYTNHDYQLGVSLVDDLGRESFLTTLSILPARPHVPENIEVSLEGLTPVVTWQVHSDTANVKYMIYRSIWDEDFVLYDSTAARHFYDFDAESGYKYTYRVLAVNDLGLTSDYIESGWVLPMAMDQGPLFLNCNSTSMQEQWFAFSRQHVLDLYDALAEIVEVDYMNHFSPAVAERYKIITDHAPLIISSEALFSYMVMPTTHVYWDPSILQEYFEQKGKVILIYGNTSEEYFHLDGNPITYRFTDGSFLHDYLKIDSSVVNQIIYDHYPDTVAGDLTGCEPLVDDYEWIQADNDKLAELVPDVVGYIPASGFIYPTDEAEPIYRYVSSNPDTINHHQINGIRYLGDDYQFVLLNFRLSEMEEPGNVNVLLQALKDLGIITTGVEDSEPALPDQLTLHQNYPNPFNPQTTIEIYNVNSRPVEARLDIYNILGQKVITLLDGKVAPGLNRLIWDGLDQDGRQVASGIYLYRLKMGGTAYTRKMALVR